MQVSYSYDAGCYKFTGKERDPESGLDNFGARYYSSALGRFMIPDWSPAPEPVPYADLNDPQSFNQYTYVKNNPLNLTDPSGHCAAGGGNKGFWWCVGHALGFVETEEEKKRRIESERQQLLNNTRHSDGSSLTEAERRRIQRASQTEIDGRVAHLCGLCKGGE